MSADDVRFLPNSLWSFDAAGLVPLPPQSLALSKQLIRSIEKEHLYAVNDAEVERLMERWTSDECFNAIMSFFQAKAKL